MKRYLAIDIGASSGRHIVGWQEDGQIRTEELYRFSNATHLENGHLTWDFERLFDEVKIGIETAKEAFPDLVSLSIDTWGVDYVLLHDEKPILPVYAYRDHRTQEVLSLVHTIVPSDELYRRTGTQHQPFNTIYQLYWDKLAGRLAAATDLLMLPEYLLWRLCKTKSREYTNATTTGLVNAISGEYDIEIVERLGYPKHLFPKLDNPGKVLGEYKGLNCVLCATHDTASAVEGIPMEGNEPYLSSGTWSLLGIKTPKPLTNDASEAANYSNEGGIGYNRYQKNIMGMWLLNELRRELCPDFSFSEIEIAARESNCDVLVDVNAPDFLAPKSMKAAFDAATLGSAALGSASLSAFDSDVAVGDGFATLGDYFRCACRSLAANYRSSLVEMEQHTGQTYRKLYIVGGGAKNTFLNELTAQMTGKQVIALPIEAAALGNIKAQMMSNQDNNLSL
jgi:rhamnulokinase